uniref:Uncharacterized LOC114453937 n=1 Tax=Gouania willdenowi TaxID=441366 RepID=A0A8C5DEG5_GOUWI
KRREKKNRKESIQTFGNGQQKNVHPKPFFYVQPPSQPYYLYQQWQNNNPYSHYGLPGGYRPCMLPYQYMQYPGFMFPQPPIYPMDYRRMCEPRFNAPQWNDLPRQHQQQHRETACSEAQTDPSEAITKLIECLDKIRSNDVQQGASQYRELDSGVASQSSGMLSPEDEKKNEEQGRVPPLTTHGSSLGESSLNRKSCWSGIEEDPPIDSSSFHEEGREVQGTEKSTLPFENIDPTEVSAGICDESTSSLVVSLPETKGSNRVSKAELVASPLNEGHPDRSYQILKLPLEGVLTPGSAGAGHLSSPSTPYYYNYLSMQTTHERMSVLSPSLDELSSRDEMFSTDLEDVDFFPKHVYTGRRLPEVCSGSPRRLGDEDETDEEEGWLLGSKRCTCACCGKRLPKQASRSWTETPKMYRDGDSEEERGFVRKHGTPRRLLPPVRQTSKLWHKRVPYKELEDRTTSDQGRWIEEDKTISRRSAAPSQRRGENETLI